MSNKPNIEIKNNKNNKFDIPAKKPTKQNKLDASWRTIEKKNKFLPNFQKMTHCEKKL
jgi:hypothetical protein